MTGGLGGYGEHVVNSWRLIGRGMRLGELLKAGREEMDEANRLNSVIDG